MTDAENIIQKIFTLSDYYLWSFIPLNNGSFDINEEYVQNYLKLCKEVVNDYKSGYFDNNMKKYIGYSVAYCIQMKARLFNAYVGTGMGKYVTEDDFSFAHYSFISNFKALAVWLKNKSKGETPEFSIAVISSHLFSTVIYSAPDYFSKNNSLIYGAIDKMGGSTFIFGKYNRCVFKLTSAFGESTFDLPINDGEIKEFELENPDNKFQLTDVSRYVSFAIEVLDN